MPVRRTHTVGSPYALAALLALAACGGAGSPSPGGPSAGGVAAAGAAGPAGDEAGPQPPASPPRDGPVLQGNRFSYCDPAAAIAAYPRFTGVPEVVARLYPSGGARDYPILDVHTHLGSTTAAEADIARRVGLHAAVDASWDAVSTARLRATYPPTYLVQFNLGEYLVGFSEEKLPAILAHFDEQRAAGAGGVKLFKALGLEIDDASGVRLRLDDPRLAPLWDRAARERWTVSLHTSDPSSWLKDKYPTSPYSKQDLVQQFIRVVERHPQTVFVAIHLLNLIDAEEELDQLGEYLDRYPNLYADVAARSQYLALRDQKHVRAFMLAHQDKLLFATDRNDEADPVTSYEEELRYWETSQTSRTYYLNQRLPGLALPPAVLEKLYYQNALRAFCGHLG